MIAFALSLPSTSHTICIGNNFSPCQSLEIATTISDFRSQVKAVMVALCSFDVAVESALVLVLEGT